MGCDMWWSVNVGHFSHNYHVREHGMELEETLIMKEKVVGLYIPGEALGNGISVLQTGAAVRQWHFGKSSQTPGR